MALSLEQVVKQLNDSVILAPGKLEDFVPPKAHPQSVDELVAELVKADHLTRFQAQHVAAGKTKSLILGNYTVLDKIGAGGMGQVFKAEHRRMKRVVAIKMLPPAVTKDAAAAARFQREVEAAARLSHSNIVAAYDADEANGAHFLVMEYVDGKDLAALVKKDGPFPVAQALDYILQAARGLEFAHSEGVVHRDIKPANLLLDKKGAVKILDMGLARMRDPLADPSAAPGAELTRSGSIMGTIDYMAPEQAMDSRQADPRSNIYSLGCTLYYLLNGRPPYGGDSVLKRLTAHQQAAIPLLSSTRPDIPPGFDAVFGRMMAKRPAARYQTTKELIAALESLRNQPASARPLPVAAVPVTPSPSMEELESITPPGVHPGSRNARKSSSKVPAVAAAIVLLLAAAGAGAWMVLGHKSDKTAQLAKVRTSEVQQSKVNPQSIAAPPKEPTPATAPLNTPRPPAPPPDVIPPKIEPPVNAAAQAAPLVAAPALPAAPEIKTAPAKPSVARPAMTVALAPMPAEQTAAADGKLPIPGAEGQREALKLVKELYKDDYALAKQPDAKAALAEKLLNESHQTKDDATALYVVLHEARDLAVEAANPELTERAIGMLASRFAIEPLPELTASLEEMTGKPHPAEANRAITEAALARVEEAQAANDFELAKRLADVALAAARKSRDPGLSKRAIEVGKTVTAAKQQWDGWQKAQATLNQMPGDAAANLIVGRYLAFVQGDWEPGFAHLAKGTDGPLKELAAKGMKPPEGAAALAELGDAWFVAAEKAKGKDKADLRAGAAYWYTQAEPSLTGLMKTIVEKRLKELGGAVAVRVVRAEMPAANGLWLPQTFDCSMQPHAITLGLDFNIQKSWTLALEFNAPNLDPGARQLFHWRDERNTRDPLSIRIYGTALDTRLCDTHKDKNEAYVLSRKLTPDVIGAWQQVAVHFDAATREVLLMLNGTVLAQGRSHIVPSADPPMQLLLGGVDEKRQRFLGQIRNVWLGNTENPGPPDAKPVAASTGNSSKKLPETMELPLAPGASMKFRLIPAGTFMMGTPDTTGREFPHRVNITRPFYLGITEVTQAQWLAVMGKNRSTFEGDLQRPVERVSWNDCQQFLERINQTAATPKFRFRLPTEAEWEYACRAGTTTKFYFGDDPTLLPQHAWLKDNANETTHPVGQLKPNPWGLYDMYGNVYDWCSDWFAENYYENSPSDDPQGPPDGAKRVLRGGSWANVAGNCRSAARNNIGPEIVANPYGLRVVCEPKMDVRQGAAVSGDRGPMASTKTVPGQRPMTFNQADTERNVANWVLSLGGKVKITSPATPELNPLEISAASQLPTEPRLLYGIDLGEGKAVTGKDLSRVEGLTHLVEFAIANVPINGEGIAHVARQRSLVKLSVRYTNLTDADLAALEGLTQLQALYLVGNEITDKGLAHLQGLVGLTHLSLDGTQITDLGLVHLNRMTQLFSLGIGAKDVADAGLVNLRSLPALGKLYLGKTQVSDSGADTLITIPSLKYVQLTGSRVTAAGAQKFKAARPDCEVLR